MPFDTHKIDTNQDDRWIHTSEGFEPVNQVDFANT